MMTRSITIRRKQRAKTLAPVSESVPGTAPDTPQHTNESLLAVPYSETSESEPPVQITPPNIQPTTTTAPSGPPSPTKAVSTTSSIYPTSADHTVQPPESTHSLILSPFPPQEPRRQSVPSMAGSKRSSVYAVAEVWEDIYGSSGTAYEPGPEYELPAYLGPHIIGSERDEDQPAVLFAVPLLPIQDATPERVRKAPSFRKSSKCAEKDFIATPSKKKRNFWSPFRFGRNSNVLSNEQKERSPLSPQQTRTSRVNSGADTLVAEASVIMMTEESPCEETNSLAGLSTTCTICEDPTKKEGTGLLDAGETSAVVKHDLCECGPNRELCHTIVVEIPRDPEFGDEFWAKFPRKFI